ncbi:MAG: 30S ribosomal protein S6 [Deltaproteobacteria bacterium]|nr:30S ribosomal protein S6 [Deltaproteobacteria bacterium]
MGIEERHYETLCIVRSDVGDDMVKDVISRAEAAVVSKKGSTVKVEEWGKKRLACLIKKQHDGFYFLLTYKGPTDASKEVDRVLGINENVLRAQTIRLESAPTAEPAPTQSKVEPIAAKEEDIAR